MHRIYTSEAIVLSSRAHGEADKIIALFTKEHGFVRAIAKSSRKESSKLRYALADRSVVLASLVRGKEWWRVTNVIPIDSYRGSGKHVRTLVRISLLLKRLIPPETSEPILFDTIKKVFALIHSSDEDVDTTYVEIGAVLHILQHLGYLAENPVFKAFYDKPFSFEAVQTLLSYKKEALETINNALNESHL